jgi:anti-sigma regulatory factor (Ser/Thr protein kinase)
MSQPPDRSASAVRSAYSGSPPDVRRCEWRFPAALDSVFEMRRGLRGFLADTALSADEIQDLLLAASEAANNAVEHAQQPTEPFFDVCTEVDEGRVTIVIQDHGGWRQPTSPSNRGRGLAMMRALAITTVTAAPHGTMVTIRSRRPDPRAPVHQGRDS